MMHVEQMYTGCLAAAAYYITNNGEAAIIDPLREVDAYLERAEADGVRIKYIFETHFHADFVSGHVELAERTGATIVYGPGAQPAFKAHIATDGELFNIGGLDLQVLHTPGHTMESACYLLYNEGKVPYCLFTGDTLFIGDVGRPDLVQAGGMTQEAMAGLLYDSLHNKILVLPDDVLIYPAHGAGSACGKNMSKETFDTLGNQKNLNYALRAETREEFVEQVTHGLMPPPQYFAGNAALNKQGYQSMRVIFGNAMRALQPAEFKDMADGKVTVLDTRAPQVFAAAFIPGSINIGIDGQFAPWVGAVIQNLNTPILLVTEEGREEETITRLSRVGYDNTIGYLAGGIPAWQGAGFGTDHIESVPAADFKAIAEAGPVNVIDVRKPGEYEQGHLHGAELMPLDYINTWKGDIEKEAPWYVHCAGGYRSMIAASVLKAAGVKDIKDVAGGFAEIKKTGMAVETA